MRYKRTFYELSRFTIFVKDVSETKRDQLGISITQYCKGMERNRSSYYRFIGEKRSDFNIRVMFDIMQQIPVYVKLEHNGKEVEPKSPQQILNFIRQAMKEHHQQSGYTWDKIAKTMHIKADTLMQFMKGQRHGESVANAASKLLRIKIRAAANYNPERGKELRVQIVERMDHKKKMDKKARQPYVSEYKKEIKERMKKLWPYG